MTIKAFKELPKEMQSQYAITNGIYLMSDTKIKTQYWQIEGEVHDFYAIIQFNNLGTANILVVNIDQMADIVEIRPGSLI